MNRQDIEQEIAGSRALKRWEMHDLNLAGLDFSGVDATGARFVNCVLKGSHFKGTVLTEAEFVGCALDGTDFSSANLAQSSFSGCTGVDDALSRVLIDGGAKIDSATAPPATRSMRSMGFAALAAVVIVAAVLFARSGREDAGDLHPGGGVPAPTAPTAAPEPTPTPPLSASEVLDHGLSLLHQGQTDEALPFLEEAVQKSPGNRKALLPLAEALMKLDRPLDARRHLEAVLSQNPAQDVDVPVRQDLAETYQRADDPASADKVYEGLAAKYAGNDEIIRGLILNHANLRWKTGDYKGALAKFRELEKISDREQLPGVYLLMGLVHLDMDEPAKARQLFQTVMRKYPESETIAMEARVHLATMDIKDGRADKALENLTSAMRAGADEGQVFNAIFKVYADKQKAGKADDAAKLLETMTRLFADQPAQLATIYVEKGKIAMEAGDLENAETDFRNAEKLSRDPTQQAWIRESLEEIGRSQASPTPAAP
ncbi:tetratricopeptide repeat protein [bacterium]|nr:tetratricopeptide repeat protein [bacterium]